MTLRIALETSMELTRESGFCISTCVRGSETTISANRAGLAWLANNLLALAEGQPGDHFHFDEYNSLEDGSTELIIELVD